MFGWMKKQQQGATSLGETGHQRLTFSLDGMHCTSCALVIDDALEELNGVHAVKTEYARSQVQLEIDPKQVSVDTILSTIADLGYTATVLK